MIASTERQSKNAETGDRRIETNIGFSFGGFDDADAADGRGAVKNVEKCWEYPVARKTDEPLPKITSSPRRYSFSANLLLNSNCSLTSTASTGPWQNCFHDGDGQVVHQAAVDQDLAVSIAGGPMPGIEMLARTAFHNMPRNEFLPRLGVKFVDTQKI